MSKERVYNDHLKELTGSDFEILKGEPDIRNWKVLAGHQEIGRVNELLFDEVSRKVKYLVVDMDGRAINLLSRKVIVPIGLTELLRKEQLVVVPELTVGHIASLPTYEKGKIPLETENEIRSVFAPSKGLRYEEEETTARPVLHDHIVQPEDQAYRPRPELVESASLKEEIKENIKKVKESVTKMEKDVEKLSKTDI
jgi:hypothetical protein